MSFEGLLPGRYLLSASRFPDALSRQDFTVTAVVHEGKRTEVQLSPEVPILGKVEFTLEHNGQQVTSAFDVEVRRGDEWFTAECDPLTGATKPLLVPAGEEYTVGFSFYDSMGSNMDCEMPQTVDIESGDQRIALSIDTARITCAMPLGWTHPEVAHWQGLRWKDAAGNERSAIDAKDPAVSEAVPNQATGRFEIDFELVPITARDLRMTIGGSEGANSSYPFEASLVAGGHVSVTLD